MRDHASMSRTAARPSPKPPARQPVRGFYGGGRWATEERMRHHSQLVLAFAIGMLTMAVIVTFAGVFP